MENKHCLYKIQTNGLEYIGVSCNMKTREKQHLAGQDRKGRTMRKYGFTMEKISNGLNYEEAYALEELLVTDKYIQQSHVLNSTRGGEGSFKHIHDAWRDGTLTPPGMTDACLKGRLEFNKTAKGKESMEKQGKWLAKEHGSKVLQREGHQSMASKIRWEKNPISHLKGKVYTTEERVKAYPQATCPNCGKIGNARAMKQWHGLDGSKCKQ